jgi:hypothetical protein
MTPIGCGVLVVLMALSAFGILFAQVAGRKKDRQMERRYEGIYPYGKREAVTGEPVRFRTGEKRFAVCQASMECGREQMEERGFDPGMPGHLAAARQYYKKELTYLLAEQALANGAISFENVDGTIRARMRVEVPEERK